MSRQTLSMVAAVVFLGITLLADTACSAARYRIILKNGNAIGTDHYEYRGDTILLSKPGGLFGFNRADVARIEQEPTDEGEMAGTPEPAAPRKAEPKAAKRAVAKGESSGTDREAKIAACQRALQLARNSMEISCSREAGAQVSAPPNLPQANQIAITEKTAEQFRKHVESKVVAIKAGSSCDYHKRKVAKLERECSGL